MTTLLRVGKVINLYGTLCVRGVIHFLERQTLPVNCQGNKALLWIAFY